MIGNSFHEKHSATVKSVARQAAYRWNGLVDAEDVEQDLWLFIMTSPSVSEYMDRSSDGEIRSALRKKADSICSQERDSYDHFTGNFHYSTRDVADILARVADCLGVTEAERMDLQLGMEELEAEYPNQFENVKKYFYAGAESRDRVDRVRKSRCLEKLTTTMNRKRSQRDLDRAEGLGTRPLSTASKEEDY
ncbi:hypothetical protein [uncultured Corynebacterium sp.]|uniref:hypothetical protein n=1 Tax=uncultured Corynebacterium sp. TaxID=159447 RepID=UPI00262F1887|nr:hypothetical protein [uncultured Corynebacterium sp.]